MAEAPRGLGDFFAKKKKKTIKGSNLNVEAAPKVEEKKTKSKEKDEDGWEEEQIVAPTMKVEVAGKLTRDDDKKDDDDAVAPAWGAKKHSDVQRVDFYEKKFPSLAKAVGASSNINLDDGSEPKLNIKTNKNAFAALDEHGDDDEEGPKRPKEIKPAMVQKQKGEREKEAIQREVDKYSTKKEDAKKGKAEGKKKKASEEEDDEEEDEADEAAEEAAAKKKRDEKKQEKAKEPTKVHPEAEEVEEDVKIQPDLVASKAKYKGRVKLPAKELPASELEEEKENRPQPQKKQKKKFIDEEESRPKLQVADWDD